MRWIPCCCLLLFTSIAGGQPAPPTETELADGPLRLLSPLIGDWQIDATWADGSKLWGRTEYRVGLAGRFIDVRTFAKDGDGEVYQRYLSIYAYDPVKQQYWSHGFIFDGTQKSTPVEVEKNGNTIEMRSRWKMEETHIRQTVTLHGDKSMTWEVYSSPDGKEWAQIMDGEWEKIVDSPTDAIEN